VVVKKVDGKAKPWLADLRPDGDGGRRIRKSFMTKGEALAWERHQLTHKPWEQTQEQKAEQLEPQEQRRLLDLVHLWFGRHGQTLADGDRRRDKLVWLCEALENPIATEFTSEHFSAYRERRLAGELYVPGQRKQVTPTTINREQLYLQAVFNELARLGVWHGGNPLSDLRQYKVQESELAYLSQDEIEQLLDACKEHRDLWLVVMLCLSTGARWSEIEKVSRAQIGMGRITFTKTKGKRNRTVPVAPWLLAMLPKRTGRLFDDCYAEFEKAIRRANIKLPAGQSTHVLRHTFASHFMMNGGNILVLQRILGHTDIKMTMRYSHFAPDHLEDAVRLNPITALKSVHRQSINLPHIAPQPPILRF